MTACNHYFVAGHCLRCDAPDPSYSPLPLSEKIFCAIIIVIFVVGAVCVSANLC
jgi:hypothetical protein